MSTLFLSHWKRNNATVAIPERTVTAHEDSSPRLSSSSSSFQKNAVAQIVESVSDAIVHGENSTRAP
jgi:hypothetical protein